MCGYILLCAIFIEISCKLNHQAVSISLNISFLCSICHVKFTNSIHYYHQLNHMLNWIFITYTIHNPPNIPCINNICIKYIIHLYSGLYCLICIIGHINQLFYLSYVIGDMLQCLIGYVLHGICMNDILNVIYIMLYKHCCVFCILYW